MLHRHGCVRVWVGSVVAGCLAVAAAQPASAALINASWDGGAGSWTTAGNWSPVGVPNNGGGDTYNVTIDSAPAADVTLDTSPTIEDLTVGSGNQLSFNNSRDLRVNGNITNDGTIRIAGTSSATDLIGNAGNLAITGAGTIELDGGTSIDRFYLADSASTITNGSGHTIAGRGAVGVNLANFVNNGTVNANITGGVLAIDPSTSFDNNATLRAENAGILQLNAGAYDSTGGTLTADGTGSEVQINSSANITGGTFNTLNAGLIRMIGTATLTDITSNGSFSINNGVDPILAGTLTNNGTFTQAGISSNTAVRIDGNGTVAGTGTWRLDNAGSTVNTVGGLNASTDTLTHAAAHTIAGAGNLGSNTLAITNHGLIVADQTNVLILDPNDQDLDGNGTDFHNTATGTLRATGAGILRLQGGTFRNDNVIEAVAGGTVQLAAGTTVVGGTLQASGGGAINLTVNAIRLEDITIVAGTPININNAIDPVLAGTITNHGSINANGTSSNTATQLDGAVTLTGNGEMVLNNAGSTVNTIQGVTTAAVLTHTATHTIRGAGNIGNNFMGLNNAGTITADQPNVLIIDPSNHDLDGNGADVINSGLMRATAGGTLRLQDGRFANQTTLRAEAGSFVDLAGGAYIDGGTLNTVGDGLFRVTANTVTLENVTLTANMAINNAIDPVLVGTLTNNGVVNQNGIGSNTATQISGNVTLAGGGQWVMNNAGSTINTFQGVAGTEVLTHTAGHTIRGAGNIGNNFMGLDNAGLILADQPNVLIIDPSNVDVDGSGADVRNTNTLRAESGGTLRLQDGVFNNQGFITAEAGSTVQFAGGATILGGSLQANGDGQFVITANTVTLDNITLNGTGGLTINNAVDPILVGTLTNNATITSAGTGSNTATQLSGNVTLAGNGQWVMNNAGSTINTFQGVAGNEVLTHSAGHTIRGAGNIGSNFMGLNNAGTIVADQPNALIIHPSAASGGATNTGTLQASGAGGLAFNGTVTNAATGTIQIDAGSKLTVTGGTFTHKDGATLTQAGDLIVTAGTFLNEAADYSPGASPGQVTVNGSGTFQNAASATVTFEIAGDTTPGVDFDTIRGTGIFALDGEIDIVLQGGFTPTFYQSVELIRDTTNGNGVSGVFDPVFNPIVGPGEAWAITYTTNAVSFTRALPGDANLNGAVEQADLDAVLLNWGQTDRVWNTGDFDGDGFVAQADLDAVLLNWGTSFPEPGVGGGSPVPEPAGLGAVVLTLLAVRRRRSPVAA